MDFETEVGGDNTATQAKVIGSLCMIYGGSVGLGALLIPNPLIGRLALAGCALLMAAIGLGLFLYGRKTKTA